MMALALIIFGIIVLTYIGLKKNYNMYKLFTRVSVLVTFGSLVLIVAYILLRGIPHLKLSMFSLNYTSENVSMLPSIITTLIVVVLGIAIATPIGISTAIYLVEYADSKSKMVEIIRLAAETLQGIPSIVYGLFGMLFFVLRLGLKYSILSGVFTISIMILPLIIRSTEEALKSVPDSIRHASFALGAGKLRTIGKIVIPAAMPGIISGIVLATGRIVGETACLIYTLGTATALPTSLFSSSRTLALHMYMLSSEGLHVGEAYATGTVLLVFVLIINYISNRLASKYMEVKS
ncbi:MAG: phosphate ABC transporter permease PstA [Tissierellia bacterium]|nr:phosphate ABC transporter permease PstA [Tissierellia bacterium]